MTTADDEETQQQLLQTEVDATRALLPAAFRTVLDGLSPDDARKVILRETSAPRVVGARPERVEGAIGLALLSRVAATTCDGGVAVTLDWEATDAEKYVAQETPPAVVAAPAPMDDNDDMVEAFYSSAEEADGATAVVPQPGGRTVAAPSAPAEAIVQISRGECPWADVAQALACAVEEELQLITQSPANTQIVHCSTQTAAALEKGLQHRGRQIRIAWLNREASAPGGITARPGPAQTNADAAPVDKAAMAVGQPSTTGRPVLRCVSTHSAAPVGHEVILPRYVRGTLLNVKSKSRGGGCRTP
eukprot:TRINITY_DN6905_c0_g1_i1.p1 TRINITY_DN6905_c0_g1~~TRINITY_DN6905_c0_g1_i1.p1  ORF type:complete len:304 (-),score=21.04 TRINITY_DN6905_c0_g1_i1:1904-2815(-)